MDIEQQLREMLVLRDPGTPFTEGVMARVAGASGGPHADGVVQLAEARTRRRSRRILLGTLVVVCAAAAMPVLLLRDGGDAPPLQQAVALVPVASLAGDPTSPGASALAAAELPASARDPQDCIDPDVLNGLLLARPGQTLHISDAAPPELATFNAPDQFTLMGSAERGADSVSAVFRTGLTPAAARAAATDALEKAGWEPAPGNTPFPDNVFVAANAARSETWCRDGLPLNLQANVLGGVTYVVLAPSRKAGRNPNTINACEQPDPRVLRFYAPLEGYLPKLELPGDPATGEAVPQRAGGSSGGFTTSRRYDYTFTLKDSAAANIARHFAQQMAAQGWSMDASWSGTATAGSTWTRRTDAAVLKGTLMVSDMENGRFAAAFNVAVNQ